jgi:hypothetical protein
MYLVSQPDPWRRQKRTKGHDPTIRYKFAVLNTRTAIAFFFWTQDSVRRALNKHARPSVHTICVAARSQTGALCITT